MLRSVVFDPSFTWHSKEDLESRSMLRFGSNTIVSALFALSLSWVPIYASAQAGSDAEFSECREYIRQAYWCWDRGEYVCAAYQFSLAEGTGISFQNEAENSEIKIAFATSLYLLDKMDLTGDEQAEDDLVKRSIEGWKASFLDMKDALKTARRLLTEAEFRRSYLYIAVTLDLVEESGPCNAASVEAMLDVIDVMSDGEPLLDIADYEEDVAEATNDAVAKLNAEVIGCFF